jgi:hypothetical protein
MKTKTKITSAAMIALASISQVSWSQQWLTSGNTNASGYILGTTGGNFSLNIKNGAAYPINFFTNGSQRATILSTGEFGIGTASPLATFECL